MPSLMSRLSSAILCAGFALLIALAPSPSGAVLPDEMLADPAMEARARVISKDIRCLVCQNQSIDDSDADLARDLRILIRERLNEGDTNDQVQDYLVARYGEYVLLNPPMRAGTLLLWGAPAILVLLGSIAVFFWFRGLGRKTAAAGPTLSAEEEARLSSLISPRNGKDQS